MCDYTFVTKMLWLKLWLKFGESNFVTKIVLVKFCHYNFVTKIMYKSLNLILCLQFGGKNLVTNFAVTKIVTTIWWIKVCD